MAGTRHERFVTQPTAVAVPSLFSPSLRARTSPEEPARRLSRRRCARRADVRPSRRAEHPPWRGRLQLRASSGAPTAVTRSRASGTARRATDRRMLALNEQETCGSGDKRGPRDLVANACLRPGTVCRRSSTARVPTAAARHHRLQRFSHALLRRCPDPARPVPRVWRLRERSTEAPRGGARGSRCLGPMRSYRRRASALRAVPSDVRRARTPRVRDAEAGTRRPGLAPRTRCDEQHASPTRDHDV